MMHYKEAVALITAVFVDARMVALSAVMEATVHRVGAINPAL
jgi:hypothetical protein